MKFSYSFIFSQSLFHLMKLGIELENLKLENKLSHKDEFDL